MNGGLLVLNDAATGLLTDATDFGNVTVDSTGASKVTRHFTLVNLGDQNLTLTEIQGPAAGTDFSVSGLTAGAVVLPGKSVSFDVTFAPRHNGAAGAQLVVKNTGHDFSGKSTGAGALGIWTHHLKEIDYIANYQSSSYQGPAVKLGAGVQAFEIYEKANELGFTFVGGEGMVCYGYWTFIPVQSAN